MQLQLREHGQPGLCHTRHKNGTFTFNNKHLLCYQVSPIDHRLVWVLVGLVGRTLDVEFLHKTVARVYQLAVVQLWNPIHHSLWFNRDRVVMRSLVVGRGDMYVFSLKTSPVFNLTTFGIP